MNKPGLIVLCGLAALSLPAMAHAKPVTLTATLDGAAETAGGDPDGSGSFSAEVDDETGDVCYVLTGEAIGAPTAAHIHEGAAGVDGKPVITIEVTGDDGDLCIAAEPDTLKPIVETPGNYYVNIHTAEFPKGAVRGQLAEE